MKTKIVKNIIGLMLSILVVTAGVWLMSEESLAMTKTGNGNVDWYNNVPQYSHSFGVIGEAYVVGDDNIVKTNSFGRGVHVDAYSATGSGFSSIVSGNVQNLYNLYNSSGAQGGANIYWPSNIEYYLCEGEKLQVLSYDDTYVYYWSPGFKSFGSNLYSCDQSVLLESHPAGVYKTKKEYVWLDLYNHREIATSTDYVGTAQILRKSLPVYQSAEFVGTSTKCYAYTQNTEVKIVDTTPVVSETGGKYYKAVIKGDNATAYLSCNNFYVYISEYYINYQDNNVPVPANYSVAKVAGIDADRVLRAYETKESTESFRSPFSPDTIIKTYPSMSDANRTCIWLNNTYAYVSTKHVKYYVDKLNIYDIVNNRYVLSWVPVPCEVILTAKENWSGKQIKIDGKDSIIIPPNTGTYTLDNAIFEGYEGRLSRQGIEITVQVNGDDTYKGSHKLYYPESIETLSNYTPQNTKITIKSSWMGENYGSVLQYSTNKKFKKAKTIYPKNNFPEVKKLKKNKKYYFRAYNTFNVKTETGSKLIMGKISKTLAVKTSNIVVAKPTMKTLSGGRKSITVNWAKYNKRGSYYEILVATNKSFTKNVEKAKPTKSMPSIKFSNLKANKKYYVKMRMVYRYYSNEYKSKWTKVKTVKTR